MTRRRKLLLSTVATLGVACVLALPSVHWRLVGWWRGEPFWRERPTSYYAARIRHALIGPFRFRAFSPTEVWVRQHLSDSLADLVWTGPPPFRRFSWPTSNGGLPGETADADALPVLLALADDPDATVRSWAVPGVESLRESAAPALPALVEKLTDPEPSVRLAAIVALESLGTAAGPAIPELRKLTADSAISAGTSETVGEFAASAIDQIGRKISKAAGRP